MTSYQLDELKPQPSALPWPHAPAGQGQWGSRMANATASLPFSKFLVKAANTFWEARCQPITPVWSRKAKGKD